MGTYTKRKILWGPNLKFSVTIWTKTVFEQKNNNVEI